MDSRHDRVEHALRVIRGFDFSLLRQKLLDAEHGPGWNEEELAAAQGMYEQFLALTFAYPDDVLIPSKLADEFWHRHILDTRAYARDCDALFGFFLHHFPYLGIRDEADAELLVTSGDHTYALLQRHFGDSVFAGASSAKCSRGPCSSCSSCGRKDTRLAAE